MARFVQPDSVVPEAFNSQALNRYSYCMNNPLKFTDPTGQFFIAVIAAIASVLGVTTTQLVMAIVIGASVGAVMAAITGGDVLKGALAGAIGGMLGVSGDLVMAVAGGALGAVVTGGDPMMGAMTAGIAAGVATCFNHSPLPSVFNSTENDYIDKLILSTASGSLSGGVTAEIFGGDFGQGALYGAAGAASGYVISLAMKGFIRADANFHEGQGNLTVTTRLRSPIAKTFKLEPFKFNYSSRDYLTTNYILESGVDIISILTNIDAAGREVTFFEYTGHGWDNGTGLAIGSGDGFTTQMLLDNKSLIQKVFNPYARIEIQACGTAFGGKGSFLYEFHGLLPKANIVGYRGAPLLFEYPNGWGIHGEAIPIPFYSGKVEFNTKPWN